MDKLLVLEALTKIGVEGPRSVHVGICKNLKMVLKDDYNYKFSEGVRLLPNFGRWPETSGSAAYSVEGDGYGYGEPGMWSLDTENGRKRYRLLAWLIHEITKEIRNEQE